MPIIKSAKKALKQSAKRHSRNNAFRALYRENRRTFEKAIDAKDLTAATEALKALQSSIDKLSKKNIIHKNNASRKVSKFVKMFKTLETSK
jgi:small subunit ribosomal protein S20